MPTTIVNYNPVDSEEEDDGRRLPDGDDARRLGVEDGHNDGIIALGESREASCCGLPTMALLLVTAGTILAVIVVAARHAVLPLQEQHIDDVAITLVKNCCTVVYNQLD